MTEVEKDIQRSKPVRGAEPHQWPILLFWSLLEIQYDTPTFGWMLGPWPTKTGTDQWNYWPLHPLPWNLDVDHLSLPEKFNSCRGNNILDDPIIPFSILYMNVHTLVGYGLTQILGKLMVEFAYIPSFREVKRKEASMTGTFIGAPSKLLIRTVI